MPSDKIPLLGDELEIRKGVVDVMISKTRAVSIISLLGGILKKGKMTPGMAAKV